jgi:lysophospholipid acyltransferase (LPLAT)-like uncharacterized protein
MPFSRGAFLVGQAISVASEATNEELDAKCAELQDALNRLTVLAEEQTQTN